MKVNPRPYPHAHGETKYSEAFVFEGGGLDVKTTNHGDANGTGCLWFDEKDVQYEYEEDSPRTLCIVNLDNSELIALRDKLNEIFPSPISSGDSGLREAVIEARDTFRHYAQLHAAKGTEDGVAKARTNLALLTWSC